MGILKRFRARCVCVCCAWSNWVSCVLEYGQHFPRGAGDGVLVINKTYPYVGRQAETTQTTSKQQTTTELIGLEVLRAVINRVPTFWVILPCSPLKLDRRFGAVKLCIPSPECICVFRTVLTINSDCFPKQNYTGGFRRGDLTCFI
jgi:hypothetical protein